LRNRERETARMLVVSKYFKTSARGDSEGTHVAPLARGLE